MPRRRSRWPYFWLSWVFMAGIIGTGQPLVAQPQLTPSIEIAQQASPPDSRSPTSPGDALKSPPSQSQPIKVSIGLHVSNLADINQTTETFDLAGYLMYRWRDPRLAYTPAANSVRNKSVTLDQIWHPALEVVNFKSSNNAETSAEILPDGTVSVQERFSKTLSSSLELRNFPFDRQSLDIVIESLQYGESMVQLVADTPKISIGKDKFVSLSEWQIRGITGNNSKSFFPPEQQSYSRVTIKIAIKRNPGFYLLKVIMPLLLLTIASWSVFWINLQEFSSQISIAFTNLLTVVALLLVINDNLPRVGYLTFMDGFTMICFMAILIAILELIISHRFITHGQQKRAEQIHHLARWIVPAVFMISNLLLLISMNFFQSG